LIVLQRLAKSGRTAAGALRLLTTQGRPDVVFSCQNGLGDEILLTALAREWKQRRPQDRLFVIARQAEIFARNPHVSGVLPPREPTYSVLSALGIRHRHVEYQTYDAATDRDHPGDTPFAVSLMCAAGLRGPVEYQPEIHLAPEEIDAASFAKNAVIIQTTGRRPGGYMLNKEWGEQRFRELHDSLRAEFPTVQIGLAGDDSLSAQFDRRGMPSIRPTAAILSQAAVFVGLAGGLMHLARAVNCPSVIIYGGRELPGISGYPSHSAVTGTPPCSPCWLRSRCDHDRVCLSEIQVARVREAVVAAAQSSRHTTPDLWAL
jgi:ADP-heptose:LPS heptosyltransferase